MDRAAAPTVTAPATTAVFTAQAVNQPPSATLALKSLVFEFGATSMMAPAEAKAFSVATATTVAPLVKAFGSCATPAA